MPTQQQQQPPAGSSVSSPPPPPPTTSPPASASPAKSRRARHARTPASLTSSVGASPSISSLYGSGSGSASQQSASDAIFASLGLDPFRTDPDELFTTLSVKQVENYANAVKSAAEHKQADLRTLVGDRYQDLLGTANTIIDMAHSSEQLCQRLQDLHRGIVQIGATSGPERKAERRSTRRLSSFAPLSPAAQEQDSAEEQMFSLGASLKMIMDAPEYVWRSIENGKTLHAAWAFMVARTAWWDLVERSPSKDKQPGASASDPADVGPRLQVDVKAAFPFIEKQWQGLVPMRKQIVQRAIQLLADPRLSFAATVDQMATVILLDGTRLEQTFALVLSQRANTIKRAVRRQRRSSSAAPQGDEKRRPSAVTFDAAAVAQETGTRSGKGLELADRAESKQLESILEGVVRGLSTTLIHLLRAFFVRQQADRESQAQPSASQPHLYDVVHRLTQASSSADGDDVPLSPTASRRASLLHSPQLTRSSHRHSPSTTSPTATRSARRRSSYGFSLPPPSASSVPATTRSDSNGHVDPQSPQPPLHRPRISTQQILHAFPSSTLLLRYLPMSVLSFTPYVELTAFDEPKLAALADELLSWSRTLRRELFDSSLARDDKAASSIPGLLNALTRIGSVTRLRAVTMLALNRCGKMAERKLSGSPPMTKVAGTGNDALDLFRTELQAFKDELDSAFHRRIEEIHAASLDALLEGALRKVDDLLTQLRREGPSSSHQSQLSALFAEDEDGAGSSGVRNGSSGGLRSARKAQNLDSTSGHLASLNSRLQGRSTELYAVVESLRSQLGQLTAEADSYLAMGDLEASSKLSLAKQLRSRVTGAVLDLLGQLQSRIPQDGESEPKSAGQSIELEPRAAFVAQLASHLIKTPIATATTELEGSTNGRDPVQHAARRLIESSIAGWDGMVEAACMEAVSRPDHDAAPASTLELSRPLLSGLSLLCEAKLRAGIAIDRDEIDAVVRRVLRALRDHCAAKTEVPVTDLAILDLLLDGRTHSPAETEAVNEVVARRRLILVPLAMQPEALTLYGQRETTGGSNGSSVMPRPASSQKVEEITMLAKPQLPRLEPLSLR